MSKNQVFIFFAGIMAAALGAGIMFMSLTAAEKQLQFDAGFQACNTGCAEIQEGCKHTACNDVDYILFVPVFKPVSVNYGQTIEPSDFSFMVCNCGTKPLSLGTSPIEWKIKDAGYRNTGAAAFDSPLDPNDFEILNGADLGWGPVTINIQSEKFLETRQIEVTLRTAYGEKRSTWELDYITQKATGVGG